MKSLSLAAILGLFLFSCSPVITVAVPDKPIEINLNVKVDHEIRVKVDKELNDVMDENEDIF